MEEKRQEIISALQEEIRVLREELAQMRELLKEKDAVITELKEQLRKNSAYAPSFLAQLRWVLLSRSFPLLSSVLSISSVS